MAWGKNSTGEIFPRLYIFTVKTLYYTLKKGVCVEMFPRRFLPVFRGIFIMIFKIRQLKTSADTGMFFA